MSRPELATRGGGRGEGERGRSALSLCFASPNVTGKANRRTEGRARPPPAGPFPPRLPSLRRRTRLRNWVAGRITGLFFISALLPCCAFEKFLSSRKQSKNHSSIMSSVPLAGFFSFFPFLPFLLIGHDLWFESSQSF